MYLSRLSASLSIKLNFVVDDKKDISYGLIRMTSLSFTYFWFVFFVCSLSLYMSRSTYFIFLFIFYFPFNLFFYFLFLEQLGLGLICHTVTSVPTWWCSHKTDHKTGKNKVEDLRTNDVIQHGHHMLASWTTHGCLG